MQSLDESSFDEAITRAEGLVVIDFWAPWCGPCQAVTPTLEALAERYSEGASFYKVNADEAPRLMSAFNLRSVPTVLILKPHEGGARVLDALVGAQTERRYERWLERYLNPKPGLVSRLTGLFKA
jgi:thioredoxin 1